MLAIPYVGGEHASSTACVDGGACKYVPIGFHPPLGHHQLELANSSSSGNGDRNRDLDRDKLYKHHKNHRAHHRHGQLAIRRATIVVC